MVRRNGFLAVASAGVLILSGAPVLAQPRPAQAATGVYTYPGPGTVNTHWIETPGGGLIVIDVQRDLTHAAEALAMVQATGKPVRAILITHGHPDHYVGAGLFKAAFPEAVIYASRMTADTIRTDLYGFNALVQRLAPDETPREFTQVGRIIDDNATLRIDGLTIVAREIGTAEANSATVYYVPSTGDLYVGDLVLNRLHALFGDAATSERLAALDRMAVTFPDTRRVHPGHGPSGTKAQLFADQRDYLVTARTFAAEEIARSGLTDEAKAATARRIKARFDYENPAGLRDIVTISVEGLFEEFSDPALTPVR